jgi:predicted DCC family thiol-disulfide oxidoreductase YuxK
VYLRTTAVLRALAALDTRWRHLAWLRVLPAALRDVAYRAFARARYRLFGRYEQCPIPSAEERARFLP